MSTSSTDVVPMSHVVQEPVLFLEEHPVRRAVQHQREAIHEQAEQHDPIERHRDDVRHRHEEERDSERRR
jgi:hypothetical protein